MKILVCISGASGASLGLEFLEILSNLNLDCEIYAIISKGARLVLEKEESKFEPNLSQIRATFLNDDDLSASVSSGSFGITHTIVVPCSANTLAKINAGICDTLITRACMVAIKEKRRLVLGVREMPFSSILLSHMLNLSNLGVVIAPPVVGFYAGSDEKSVKNLIFGKWLDALGIENSIFKRWQNG